MLLNYIKKTESQKDIKKENYIKESVKNMIKNEEKIISNIKKLFEAKKYFKHNSFEILISFVKKMKR